MEKYLEKRSKTIKTLLNSNNERSLVGKSLLGLQRGLTGERTLVGSAYMQDAKSFEAYLLYYWPVSYTQMWHILWSAKDRIITLVEECKKNGRPLTVLDLGSGPAPASCALCDVIEALFGQNSVDISLELFDTSERALDFAKTLLSSVSIKSVKTKKCSLENESPKSADIVLMSHALNELYVAKSERLTDCTHFLEAYIKKLSPEGFLAVSEPALLQTSRFLIQVRSLLVNTDTVCVLYPCLKNCACPVLTEANHTCHADLDWDAPKEVKALAKEAALDRHSVKMTYFVLAKKTLPAAQKEAPAQECFLVTSDAMLNKAGRVRYLLCDGKKRIAFSAKQGDAAAEEAGFFSLKRYDKIIIQNPEIRENGALGFVNGTKICYI